MFLIAIDGVVYIYICLLIVWLYNIVDNIDNILTAIYIYGYTNVWLY